MEGTLYTLGYICPTGFLVSGYGDHCKLHITDLMGMFEKRRFRKFLMYCADVNEEDQKTWDGFNITTSTMDELFKKFGLDNNTADITGHALALHLNDE